MRNLPPRPHPLLPPVPAALATLAAVLALAITAVAAPGGQGPAPRPLQAAFAPAADGTPEGWQPISFQDIDRATTYTPVAEDGRHVLRAEAERSASGLVWQRRFDPRVHRIVAWEWKVAHVLPRGDVTRKSGDDFAARLLVLFPYDPQRASLWERIQFNAYRLFYGEYPPGRALTYIWANRLPRGRWVTSTYTGRVRLHSVRSGNARAGRWVRERRDIAADYRAAFGEPVPHRAQIAVMVDTDNTGDRVTSWFGPIRLLPAEGVAAP